MSDKRLYVLIKTSKSYFTGHCYCGMCKTSMDKNLKKYKWELIQTGSSEEVFNQEKILNKLYGKS